MQKLYKKSVQSIFALILIFVVLQFESRVNSESWQHYNTYSHFDLISLFRTQMHLLNQLSIRPLHLLNYKDAIPECVKEFYKISVIKRGSQLENFEDVLTYICRYSIANEYHSEVQNKKNDKVYNWGKMFQRMPLYNNLHSHILMHRKQLTQILQN